jgi:hypothetical protein
MKASSNYGTHWTAAPVLRVSNESRTDEYRLNEGRVEFRPAEGLNWRELVYPDLQQHLILHTKVGQWIAKLYFTAELAKVLSNN